MDGGEHVHHEAPSTDTRQYLFRKRCKCFANKLKMRANRPLSHPFSADDINYTDAVYQRAFWFIGHCKYGGIIIMAAADLRTTAIGI